MLPHPGLNQRKSSPSIQRSEDSTDHDSTRNKFSSISSEIVPQTLTHPEEDDSSRSLKSPGVVPPPNWSNVGFQSIFNGGGQRRSKQSLLSTESRESTPLSGRRSNDSGLCLRRDDSRISEEDVSNQSVHTSSSSAKAKLKSSLFGKPKEALPKSERTSRLFKSPGGRSQVGVPDSLISPTIPNKKNKFTKIAKKFFNHKNTGTHPDDVIEPVIPNSLSKFLHSSYARHKTPSQFLHNTPGPLMDSKSVYSFNPSISNNAVDVGGSQQDDYYWNSLAMLHDFLKHLPTLEANYRNFNTQELHVLEGNVWGIFCNTVLELFKSHEVWQLHVKIEDINRILEFYITLKTESKAASQHSKFLSEVTEFLSTSLYILENQIVFNYTNENTMNTALKRLGVIWQVFYQRVYYDVMAVLSPLEKSFTSIPKYWSYVEGISQNVLSVDYILLKSFRDSIVLPYYLNFINSNDGASKSFQLYIFNQEEENGVTEEDKLTLLQCFGVLSTIPGNDRHQKIIQELLAGVRMSI
ncbi:related to target of rapamycin complex 2 subunit BIT2 [Zygosaccharomyces bailii ISA1307]|uniref:ZYBA0S03-06062g1_1 n=1 Tax=Zygosaccharomyces bailii (strain CLIB 213 / ATCC 58445 / CBS 680 / BCRC 21525 / NBRC 1098 / NCYC 1416 / NRRL Y-2227) TaxID=1333698 RepID=A0A8J2WYE2_ZYGB2|nr:ZYBA0S03-06062g1_1 [Zygosaccharomyces bailii CLIB 213]CDH16050.1 related to target of rapamycin complex 2 subunit BIT2 [Zygosaccharomyces bailii ISA1307]